MHIEESFIALLVAAIVLGPPILAILAFVRVRRLEAAFKRASSNEIEARLSRLERRIAEAAPPAGEVHAAAPPPETPRAAPVPPRPIARQPFRVPPGPSAPSPARADSTPAAESDLESVIGGRWLNWLGIAALLLGVAFFLKFAFDNAWLGPNARVALGLLSGAALLIGSETQRLRAYRYYAEGIAGLGAGVLYLSLYSGWSLYHIFPQSIAFGGMIAVTAVLILIAVRRDSVRIALIALAGGFATPAILSTGADAQVELFTYLAILDASLLTLARLRSWRALEIPSLIATIVYYQAWYARFYSPERLGSTAAYATLFFVLFAALPVLRSRKGSVLAADQITLVLGNVACFLAALHRLLWAQHRWSLTFATLALAAGHLLVAARAPSKIPGARPLVPLLYGGLALTFATLAVPIRLEGKWIAMAWAVEGATLVWVGFRASVRELRWAGLVLFVLVCVRLAAAPIPAHRLLLNERAAAYFVAVAAFVFSCRLALRRRASLDPGESLAFGALAVGANVAAIWMLSLEAWDALGRAGESGALNPRLARQAALSLLWVVYATGLVIAGVRARSAPLRWQGLALFAIVVIKAFTHDLTFLSQGYRVVSFLVLGVVLVLVAFYYQRRAIPSRGAGP